MPQVVQEIVSENINDLEYIKLALTLEIERIQNTLEELPKYQEVQNYISSAREKENLKKNNIYKDPKKAEVKDRIKDLRDSYSEVEEYATNKSTLKFYQESLKKVDNFVCINGIIYNKVKENRSEKFFYSPKTALKHLLIIKQSQGLPLETSLEELNNYINAIRTSLQDYTHYEDDKEVDNILISKVYENPHNYDIRNVEEMPVIDQISLIDDSKLSSREENAFYGPSAYKALGLTKPKNQVKRIGERKNARHNSSNIN